jgi:hypothetical protein
MTLQSYIIRGGLEGRARLRIIARVMRPLTLALLTRAGVREGLACLDAAAAVATSRSSWRGWSARPAG